ncbi:MAG: helix-turn-helix transcriptional regulator [Bacteroidota bacterium]
MAELFKDQALSQVGRRIKEIRRGKRMNLQELAEKSHVTAGLISKIENFRTIPSLPVLLNIARALEVEMADLVSEVSNSQETPFQHIPYEKEGDAGALLWERSLRAGFARAKRIHLMSPAIYRPAKKDLDCLICFSEGAGEMEMEDSQVKVEKGDLLYMRGEHPFLLKPQPDGSLKFFLISFQPADQ